VIGARRVRQGLGPFIVRMLGEHGAEVCAFLSTSDATLLATRAQLKDPHGDGLELEPRGYTDLGKLLANEALDALVILSPVGRHLPYLEAALDRGLHVLCEKPLVWDREWAGPRSAKAGPKKGGSVATCDRLVRAFQERRLLLRENCQWPQTLEAFFRLHPGARATLRKPRCSFHMRLTPANAGARMIPDAAPHPLSLLQAVWPDPTARVAGVEVTCEPPPDQQGVAALSLRFRYRGEDVDVAATVDLAQSDQSDGQAREACYSINGFRAVREVRMPDYALAFTDGGRRVDVPDPLDALIGEFVQALRKVRVGPSTSLESGEGPAIRQRIAMLDNLAKAFETREQ